jgi:Cu+-exporting ATPase
MVKPVSQSYLTSLWNQESFRKEKTETLLTLTNLYSFRFTKLVVGMAMAAAIFWLWRDPSRALKAFTSVLIVACPCALALAAPFTLGTALRVLGRRGVFVKSPVVVETMARVNTVVFDKTGTLTSASQVQFIGAPLNEDEARRIYSLARHSTHPLSVRIAEHLANASFTEPVRSFIESTGQGIEGLVGDAEIWLGSAAWLYERGLTIPETALPHGSVVHVAYDCAYRGCFVLTGALRPEIETVLQALSPKYELSLLSGDNERERARFAAMFGESAQLHFHQSPLDKFEFIRSRQQSRRTVMMVGDGLNDAGALKQGDVGVAVVEHVGAFSPASDVILGASMVPQLDAVLRFAKDAVRIVRLSFFISAFYNLIGIGIAASGLLSPVVCAVLMPISSISVVAFACGATAFAGRKLSASTAGASSITSNSLSQPQEAA